MCYMGYAIVTVAAGHHFKYYLFIPHIYTTLQLSQSPYLTHIYTSPNVHTVYITLHFTQCTYYVHYFTLLIQFIVYIITSRLHFLHILLHHAHSLHASPSKIYLHYGTTQ